MVISDQVIKTHKDFWLKWESEDITTERPRKNNELLLVVVILSSFVLADRFVGSQGKVLPRFGVTLVKAIPSNGHVSWPPLLAWPTWRCGGRSWSCAILLLFLLCFKETYWKYRQIRISWCRNQSWMMRLKWLLWTCIPFCKMMRFPLNMLLSWEPFTYPTDGKGKTSSYSNL